MQPDVAEKSAQPTSPHMLDIRGMASPANVLCVLQRANTLPPGIDLELHSDCNPWQLYDLLQQRGYTLRMARAQDGTFIGTIRQRDLTQLKH